MRLENMEKEFPKMPQEMRDMIEREVEKQVKTSYTVKYTNRKNMAKRMLIASMVAALMVGTTVFAGVVYQMQHEQRGEYGVETTIERADTEQSVEEEVAIDIPAVKMELGYLPEGMVEVEEGKYSYEDSLYQGGISIFFYQMDTGDDQFEMLTTDVLSSEDIQVGGRDGVYLLLNEATEEEISFNQRIYVGYTNVHYVMEMYVASDVSKEDALKVAEGVTLIPVEDSEEAGVVKGWLWSEYFESLQEENENAETERYANTTVSIDEMKNTHQIGESFVMDASTGLEVKIEDVKITDNLGLLDFSAMDEDFEKEAKEEIGADGKLLPATLNYVKYGDGINALTEVVDSREVAQKLVYATVEYTNTGNEELSDVLFYASMVSMTEDGNQMKMYYGEEPQTEDAWDEVIPDGAIMHREMWYYDVHGGERGNNYIANIKPGETVTVHMAWLVPEEELDLIYLNLDPYGGAYEFDEHSLNVGYVDIRSK